MPKYRLSNAEVQTLLNALEDAVQYRSMAARMGNAPAHREIAARYQDMLDAVEPITIDRITVRHTWGVKPGTWEVRQADGSVYGTYSEWVDARDAADAIISATDESVSVAYVNEPAHL